MIVIQSKAMIMSDKSSPVLKFTFSGHDSFQCRQLWLKKGYDFINNKKSFNDEDAVVKLGVGKNMVSSIRYWMKAFNIIDNKDFPTEFGTKLFGDDGWDPFLEDDASLWLLHYQLVKTNLASTYNLIFNEFRKEKILFDKETYVSYLNRKAELDPTLNFNLNTVADDFVVFTKMYQGGKDDAEIEDSFSGILSELDLVKSIFKEKEKSESEGKKKTYIEFFQIENTERDRLPEEVLLFSILDNLEYGSSIGLNSLEYDINSPGSIFAMNRLGLVNKISEIVNDNKQITFTDDAGIKELQFKIKPNPYSILDTYYGK
jgi:hypothetical protein